MKTDHTLERGYQTISDLQLQVALIRAQLLIAKYRPDQPRVPAGSADGGQWTADGGGTVNAGRATSNSRAGGKIAMGRRLSEAECEDLYTKDTFHCTMVGLRSCHAQAAARYGACLAGQTIPPLNY